MHVRRMTTSSLLGGALALAMLSTSGLAESDTVTVASVSTLAGHEDVTATLKSVLATELAKINVPAGQRLLASASLTTLEIKKTSDGVVTRAVVSIAVRDHNGNLKLLASGSGAIVGKKADKASELDVVSAAARGASKQLGSAIGK
jgi:hypothetical protein